MNNHLTFNPKFRIDFLNKLKPLSNLEFPINQYLIWGSGPLAIRSLREGRDVDIIVTNHLWEELTKKYTPEGLKNNKIVIGDFEIWSDLLNLTDRIDEIIADCDMIDGYPFMKLSYTLEWKKFWNSKKDPQDIFLIEQFLQGKKSPQKIGS